MFFSHKVSFITVSQSLLRDEPGLIQCAGSVSIAIFENLQFPSIPCILSTKLCCDLIANLNFSSPATDHYSQHSKLLPSVESRAATASWSCSGCCCSSLYSCVLLCKAYLHTLLLFVRSNSSFETPKRLGVLRRLQMPTQLLTRWLQTSTTTRYQVPGHFSQGSCAKAELPKLPALGCIAWTASRDGAVMVAASSFGSLK